MSGPNIVTMPASNLTDIVVQLRCLADSVETSPEKPVSCVVVLGFAQGTTTACAYGHRVNPLEVQGWLFRAAHEIGTSMGTRAPGGAPGVA
jgi:hypothetical protein